MLIVIRKRKIRVLTVFLLLFCVMAGILFSGPQLHQSVMAQAGGREAVIYVVDAGHGGEDGGAVAADGTAESGINLAVAMRLRTLLRFFGAETAATRTEDVSIHDPDAKTFRARKASDLENRVELVNQTDHAVLLSIHQNSLPSVPSVHGAQAFYNERQGGRELAESIQSALNTAVNTENEKMTREIPKDIYLMNHVQVPAVLIECGFLSNPVETEQLKKPSYQLRLAAAILSGVLTADSP